MILPPYSYSSRQVQPTRPPAKRRVSRQRNHEARRRRGVEPGRFTPPAVKAVTAHISGGD